MFASACIGVSHLVQSTRAGALAGMGLVWVILAANAAKYPFFEFGSRYASATGESLIEGYRKLGKAAPWMFLILTVGTCFFVTAAVGLVTGAFLDNLIGFSAMAKRNITPYVTAGLFAFTWALLRWGRFNALDKIIKVLASVLVISTILAVVTAAFRTPQAATTKVIDWHWTAPSSIFFVIALMGWMPSAVDLSTWNSFWTLERIRTSGYRPSLAETLREFNWGYAISVILAIGFLVLGALVLYNTGETLPADAAGFASGIVGLYAKSMGTWSKPIMAATAFSAMFSTFLTVVDGYARSLDRAWATANGAPRTIQKHRIALWILSLGGLTLVLAFQGQLKSLVDLATTLSFLIAPVIARWNYKLVNSRAFPTDARPSRLLNAWAWLGWLFLVAFVALYAWARFNAWT